MISHFNLQANALYLYSAGYNVSIFPTTGHGWKCSCVYIIYARAEGEIIMRVQEVDPLKALLTLDLAIELIELVTFTDQEKKYSLHHTNPFIFKNK